jgi:hypothetical protein
MGPVKKARSASGASSKIQGRKAAGGFCFADSAWKNPMSSKVKA